ncbi:MAG: phosphate propanoyltransferase [Elusimicrobiota bacterium]
MAPAPDLVARIAADLDKGLRRSQFKIPVGISHRHFHITREHWEILFGKGTEPSVHRQLGQPGFWAAKEKVDMEGPKGRINGVRLVAPYRPHTQSEVSRSDARVLGLDPPVRGSGDLKGAAPIRFIGPKGSLEVREAVIIAQRHLHLHPDDSRRMGIADGEIVRVRAGIGGQRELVFEEVLARVSDKFALEFHIDSDEANAAWLSNGDFVHVV